jgi:hypothetical protein
MLPVPAPLFFYFGDVMGGGMMGRVTVPPLTAFF